MNFFKNLFRRKPIIPHVCEYKCVSYCTHYGISTELSRAISHPTDNHYPSQEVIKDWIKQGYDHAQVFQSHWDCSCGKTLTFFFLANPSNWKLNNKRNDTITQNIYDEMITYNPFQRNSSKGISMTEITNQLCDELCGTRKEEPYKPMSL